MAGKNSAIYDLFSKALVKSMDIKKDMADDLAIRVLNYFGYSSTILDNTLNQEDRRLFYFLQDLGLLETQWDETTLPVSGRGWRIFYWQLDLQEIRELAKADEKEDEEETGLYESLPENVWSREATESAESA